MNNFLHLEITTRCRLECPRCNRTILGKQLKNIDLPLEQFERIAKSREYKKILFCGTNGDCIYHPEFYQFVKVAKENNINITIHTNGSGKSVEWWEQIFQLMDSRDILNIAMDGFNNTVGTYRVNFKQKDFDKNIFILKLAKEKYNLRIVWSFIPFAFNENQIKEAAEFAIKNGIPFLIKKSMRWKIGYDNLMPSNKNLISKVFVELQNKQ